MLNRHLVVSGFTVDKFDGEIFRAQVVSPHPGSHIDSFAQADLPFPPALGIQFQSGPGFAYLFFPGSQHARALVVVLLNAYALLNLKHIEARGIFFHHAPHTEGGSAGAYGLFHDGDPAMRNTVCASIIKGRDHFSLKCLIERETVRLVLRVGIIIFALLADGPAIFAIVALVPPAIQHTAIWLSIERSFLPACPAGLVRANWIVEPQIRARYQEARHDDIVVFQEDDFATESIAAREAIDLFDQRFAWSVGRMRLAREDDLHRALRVIDDTLESFQVAENEGCAFIRRETPRETDNQGIRVQHALELRHLDHPFAQAQVMLAQVAARILNKRSFPL